MCEKNVCIIFYFSHAKLQNRICYCGRGFGLLSKLTSGEYTVRSEGENIKRSLGENKTSSRPTECLLSISLTEVGGLLDQYVHSSKKKVDERLQKVRTHYSSQLCSLAHFIVGLVTSK